jgi:hypothetical protein
MNQTGRSPIFRTRSTKAYDQHRPAETALFDLVTEHLETFLATAREAHERGLPRYVEGELQAYLRCGIHAYGFLRARCRECGKELLVAFSCKRRGVCPSCNARRMCGTAAHLTDRVFPAVPVRQWVLSVPFELRLLLARDHRALSAIGRLFVREILRTQSQRAAALGIPKSRGGAVCFPQRFGGSLNLNVHDHVAVPDGVVTRSESASRAEFHPLPPPDAIDVSTVTHSVEVRALEWLRRRGLLSSAEETDPDPPRSAIDACLAGSLGMGELTALGTPEGGGPEDSRELPTPRKSERRSSRARGFDVHAGVRIEAHDREGRERLLRYCARPPLSLARLSRLPDGRVAYALRKPWGRQTHRVMRPVDFLARLAALIPPPRHPLIRFHGVLAPHSSWRKAVVPTVDLSADPRGLTLPACKQDGGDAARAQEVTRNRAPRAHPATNAAAVAPSPRAGPDETDLATFSRIPWAELLKRVHDVDALVCPCGGRLRFIALILEPAVAQAILESLHLPSRPPPLARARAPDDWDS